jgi:hypothetical protein
MSYDCVLVLHGHDDLQGIMSRKVAVMKKVRYALGAVGLGPALGMMMPNVVAVAANHAPKTMTKTKTVSLQKAGCTAHTAVSKHGTSELARVNFWYNTSGCIGTVTGDKFFGDSNSSSLRIRIYNQSGEKKYEKYLWPANHCGGPGLICWSRTVGVHQLVTPIPMEVCIAWVSGHAKAVQAGPVCKSVS